MSKVTRIRPVDEEKRWRATIVYRVTETEDRSVVLNVWELQELQAAVERGPTFCAIKSFNIEYCGPKETIQESYLS